MIIKKKARKKKGLSEGITDTIMSIEVTQSSSPIDLAENIYGQLAMLIWM